MLGEQAITRIPLAPPEVAGSLNLRGRIVTAIDLRRRLGLPPAPQGTRRMSVVAEQGGELYALLVDQVAEVMRLPASAFERNPPTLPAIWAALLDRDLPAGGSAAGGAGCRQAAGAGASRAEAAMAQSCLVVDDSRVVRKVARRILEGHGFAVIEAADGQQALDACRPGDAGLRAARLEHAGDERHRIPARRLRAEFGPDRPAGRVLHDRNDMSFIEQAIEHGAQEFIMKPFDEDILIGKFAQVGLL